MKYSPLREVTTDEEVNNVEAGKVTEAKGMIQTRGKAVGEICPLLSQEE